MPYIFSYCSQRYASSWSFPLECSEIFYALHTASVCSLVHRTQVQPVFTESQRHPYQMFRFVKKHFLRYVGLFPTDWEEDFPSQLSLFTWSLWHSLSLTNSSLKSAFHHNLLSHFCLFLWGMTNIENTCRQCQADAASLLYITWCSSSETFHFHLKILPTPP